MIKNFLSISYELQLKTLEWRNSTEVTKYFQIQDITLDTHVKWLKNLTKKPPKSVAFLIYWNQKPVGVTYLYNVDYAKYTCEWGMYIYDRKLRGKGIGKQVLDESILYAKQLGMNKMSLEVLSNNQHALTLYTKTGFLEIESKKVKVRCFTKNI